MKKAETGFHKYQHLFIKILKKFDVEVSYSSKKKAVNDKLTANIILIRRKITIFVKYRIRMFINIILI